MTDRGDPAKAKEGSFAATYPRARVIGDGPEAIAAAANCLAAGGLVAFPTETVYGLGADATQSAAVARLFQAKGRPVFNPLITHVVDLGAAQALAQFDERSLRLATAFWPGPLTLVLPRAEGCPVADLATSGLPTIAVRIPQHPLARAILTAFGKPVVAPSANRSGQVSPTSAAHVMHDLGDRIDLVVDGGRCRVGVESTIVGCFDTPVLLRPGGIATADIERVLGEAMTQPSALMTPQQPLAPGMLESHYAPSANLRLNANDVRPNEALLAFGKAELVGIRNAGTVLNLSERGDLIEAASRLFGHLRTLDETGVETIAVMTIPHHDLGEAINDRLRRAAAPRLSRSSALR